VTESSGGAKKMRKCRLWWKQSAAAAGGEVASTAALALLCDSFRLSLGQARATQKTPLRPPPHFFLAAPLFGN
jgi:hypothetical protein